MKKKIFTLPEILIVISLIIILLVVIFIAVDPTERFSKARNDRRWTDVSSILEAIVRYPADNNKGLPMDNVSNSVQLIGKNTSNAACNTIICQGETVADESCFIMDLDTILVDTYLTEIPADPKTGDYKEDSRYFINKTADGRIKVGACDEELGATIEVSR